MLPSGLLFGWLYYITALPPYVVPDVSDPGKTGRTGGILCKEAHPSTHEEEPWTWGSTPGLGALLVHALLAHVAQKRGHRGLVVEAVQPELLVEADGQVDGDRLLAFLPVAGPECAFVPSYRMFNGRLRSDPGPMVKLGSANSIHCWRLSEFDPAFVLCCLRPMISVLACSEGYTGC